MEFLYLLLYFLIAVIVAYVCYLISYVMHRKKCPKDELGNFKYDFTNDSIIFVLIGGFWPVGIPCALLALILSKLHKKLVDVIFTEKKN